MTSTPADLSAGPFRDAPSGTTTRRLLAVHAHPDDETIGNGVTLARYVAEGAQVTLVTCTLGEEGEVLVPALEMLAADQADQLGGYRLGELARAMQALGVTDHRLLGGIGRYRDSGMMGTPSNAKPRAFWNADLDEAAGHLVAVIREVRPQVVLTYDENGGYGHPDHIQAHRVAMRGSELAADPAYRPDLGEAWAVAKLYWGCTPRSRIQRGIDALIAAGHPGIFGMSSAADVPWALPDEQVTTAVEGTRFVPAKMDAMRAHASQITGESPFFRMVELLGDEAMGTEFYFLARGETGPRDPATGWEDDVFAGVDGS